jgi:dTDP-4-amino-4,6-dideoxygalactose transaminase
LIKFLDLHAQYLSIKPSIDAAIAGVIKESAFVGGAQLSEFELQFGKYQQVKHCVGVANGTDAIEIALESLNLPKESEVIVPANTFIATSEAVSRLGHKVVFADVLESTYCMDPADARRRITPRTRAIILVHLYGHSCEMEKFQEIAAEHQLQILEDCAQAHGAEYLGKRVGGIGTIGTFSFYPGKNLGAYGDGGAITTNNSELAIRCRMIANHGRIGKYDHQFEGRNSRLDNLQAAILLAKLPHLDKWIDARNSVAHAYALGLEGVGDLVLPTIAPEYRHAFHLFVIRTSHRDELAQHLMERNIQTGIHYPISLPKLKAYSHLGQENEQLKANIMDRTLLSLPIGEHLSGQEVSYVIEQVKSFFHR